MSSYPRGHGILDSLRRLALQVEAAIHSTDIGGDARHALERAQLDMGDAIRAEERRAAFIASARSSGGVVPPLPPELES